MILDTVYSFQVQSTFYRYVAAPLFEEWHRLLDSPLSNLMTRNLTSNQVLKHGLLFSYLVVKFTKIMIATRAKL